MPDQSSAATEHAILQEITAPLEHLPDDPVSAVHADFPVALRGYDRMAVDAYVQRTSQLVAELQATRSPEAAVRRALERVGDQISGILQRAHETAEQITAQSRGEAEDRLEQARVEAAEVAARAAQRVRDLDADTDRIWIERHRIVDDARDLASQLLALAETAAERFPEDSDPDSSVPFDAAETSAQPPFDDEAQEFEAGEPEADEAEGFYADAHDEQTEHEAANEEEDDVLTDEAPVDEAPTAPADDAAWDDVEATRPFSPLDLRDEETTRQSPVPPPGESRRSAIPPASQAANRRNSE